MHEITAFQFARSWRIRSTTWHLENHPALHATTSTATVCSNKLQQPHKRPACWRAAATTRPTLQHLPQGSARDPPRQHAQPKRHASTAMPYKSADSTTHHMTQHARHSVRHTATACVSMGCTPWLDWLDWPKTVQKSHAAKACTIHEHQKERG